MEGSRVLTALVFSFVLVASSKLVTAAPREKPSTTFSTLHPRSTPAGRSRSQRVSRKGDTPQPPRTTLAALRVSSPEVLTFERAGYAEVRYVSVRVLNTGKGEGRQIDLSLQVGEGLAFPLKGPKRLPPKGSAVYTSSVRFPAEFASRARVVARCATCRE